MHPTRTFKKPQHLVNVWEDYKEHVKEQSDEWRKVQYVGKEGDRKSDPQKIPLTFEGFKRFCYAEGHGTVEHYFVNKDGLYKDFGSVCAQVKNEIREDQIIGGLLGFYNPSITQRLNGLTEKSEVKMDGETKVKISFK